MGLLGTKTSFHFVGCISYWPQYSLKNDDLTRIFCKKFFPILFNISQPIMAVRKVREVFVVGSIKNIKILHFFKIHLGLVTIVFAKQWLKQEISAKMFLLALFSSFNFFVILTVFTFNLDQFHCCWKYFYLFLPLLPLFLLLLFYLWLLCNFVLTFTLTFTWYTLTTDTL